MKRHAIYLWAIFLLFSLSPGRTGEESREAEATLPDLQRLRQEIQRLKDTYRTKYLDRDSDDLLVFDRIGEAARSSPEMFDALIDLCKIKETPTTTEKYSPLSLTPAGKELQGLGIRECPRIDAALAQANLTAWQRAVLEEVRQSLRWWEAKIKGLPLPPDYEPRYLSRSDFDYVTAETADILMSNPPPEWLLYQSAPSQLQSALPSKPQPETPPQAQAQISAKSQIQPSRKTEAAAEPASSFSWWVAAAVAAVLALAVAWLIRKRRK